MHPAILAALITAGGMLGSSYMQRRAAQQAALEQPAPSLTPQSRSITLPNIYGTNLRASGLLGRPSLNTQLSLGDVGMGRPPLEERVSFTGVPSLEARQFEPISIPATTSTPVTDQTKAGGIDKGALMFSIAGGLSNILGSVLGRPRASMPVVAPPHYSGHIAPFVPTEALYDWRVRPLLGR